MTELTEGPLSVGRMGPHEEWVLREQHHAAAFMDSGAGCICGTVDCPTMRLLATLDAARTNALRAGAEGIRVGLNETLASQASASGDGDGGSTTARDSRLAQPLPVDPDLRALSDAATPGPWVQGAFIDGREYDHMGDEWKAARRAEEKRTIRARGVKGNHVAITQDLFGGAEPDAAYIVALVNAHRARLAAPVDPGEPEFLARQETWDLIREYVEDPEQAQHVLDSLYKIAALPLARTAPVDPGEDVVEADHE